MMILMLQTVENRSGPDQIFPKSQMILSFSYLREVIHRLKKMCDHWVFFLVFFCYLVILFMRVRNSLNKKWSTKYDNLKIDWRILVDTGKFDFSMFIIQ